MVSEQPQQYQCVEAWVGLLKDRSYTSSISLIVAEWALSLTIWVYALTDVWGLLSRAVALQNGLFAAQLTSKSSRTSTGHSMNRRLLDPFQAIELPEIIEEYLEHGTPICLAFNRRGTLLAVGTAEGKVVIWDFETRGVARELSGHRRDVTSVCWSRSGRFLASGSLDNTLILWDVLQAEQSASVDLGAPLYHVSLSAQPPFRCVASLAEGAPQLVDFNVDAQESVPLLAADEAAARSRPDASTSGLVPALASALFMRGAEMLLVAHARGSIAVMDARTLRFLDVVKVPGSARVLGMHLNRKANLMLANCSDRVLRLYEVRPRSSLKSEGFDEDGLKAALAEAKPSKSGSQLWAGGAGLLMPGREFQNAVERMAWRSACFSSDGEHVVAAYASKHGEHHLYIFNRLYGHMERILEGPAKEGVREVLWHPQRSCLLSISAGGPTGLAGASPGRVYIWSKVYAENWSAFAPDFQELEENHEYAEREDEFDWNTPAVDKDKDKASKQITDEAVDVTTVDLPAIFSSDDEDNTEEQLHYLPAEVQPEEGDKEVAEEASSEEAEEGMAVESDSEEAEDVKDPNTVSGPRKRKVKWNDDWADPSKVDEDGEIRRGRE